MKRIAWLLLLIVPLSGAVKKGLLPEVGRPELMEISGEYLFLLEGATLYQYRLEDYSFVRSFGRAGEGPGELKVIPSIVNYLIPLEQSVLVVGMDKAIEFSHKGEVIREFRIPQFTNYLRPLNDGFLAMRFRTEAERTPDMDVFLADKELRQHRLLYSQKLSGGRNLMNLTFDGVCIAVTSRDIFIDLSPEGFVIARYHHDGETAGLIRHSIPPIPFTAEREAAAIDRIKANPEIKRIGWENIRDAIRIVHEDYFPLIQDITAEGDRLWIMTAERRDGNVRFMQLDPSGRIVHELWLPEPMDAGFTNQIFGRPARFYRFHEKRYYYLRENSDEECWQILTKRY
ncbi:MAG: hypothetical protein JXA62_04870 [Candidatus Aminicenantes bacterium]|nr:hypothetical protein [Candidatus Aminicenantes bacterium]